MGGVRVLRVRVFYHDKCFDGACSASLFTRFHRERIVTGASYEYHGLVHRAGALFDEDDFTGDENAIVDFKYSASPRITWWFDHHQSAFLTPAGPGQFSRLPGGSGLRFPQVLRSDLRFLHWIPGPHRLDPVRIRHRAGSGVDPLGQHRGRRALREPGSCRRNGPAGDEADPGHRVQPGSGVCSPAHSAVDGDASGRSFEPALCGRSSAAVAGAPQAGSRTDPQVAAKTATAPSSSISPTIPSKDSTSSSPTTCIQMPPTRSGCRSRASAPR